MKLGAILVTIFMISGLIGQDIDPERVLELAEQCAKTGPTIVECHTLETKPFPGREEEFSGKVRIMRSLTEIADYLVVPTRRGIDIATSPRMK